MKEYQEYFTVRTKALLYGKNVEISNLFPHRHPFFITLKSDPKLHYMLPSFDFGIDINDFVQEGFILRICESVFDGFKKHVLENLAVNFPVEYKLLKKISPE
ncbi:hypothetical protein SAMN06265348_107332 [Pedobacter westerhofensis]|uniref:Uncharacterized protein n=1 Tax=Pedobacter westerhofensis TaxID=425512 RepID=A0A521ECY6_9SPHI|nr:hypothetical protein [Pedobacter westerhofensis]SMO81050.1 hypothetical protein SAMN06265348_107332 [Pedobacter westerhofensis]